MIRLTVLILAHKNPQQLQLLVDSLLDNECDVLIHIDKKEKEKFGNFTKRNKDKKGLWIYSCYKVYWGSFNQIKATMFLLREALQRTQFDFVRLISGQDLPIRPLKEFREFLAESKDKSYISYTSLPAHGSWAGNGGLDRTELFWITDFNPRLGMFFNRLNVVIHLFQRLLRIKRKAAKPLFGGANWFTLNRRMAAHVVRSTEIDKAFYSKFRFTRCADEVILQTILLNSDFAADIVNDVLCYVDWEKGPEFPRSLTIEDRDKLLSSAAFFARKFDIKKDAVIITEVLQNL